MIIGFAGDIMLGRLVNDHLRSESMTYPWGDLLPLLHATDTNIGNLETTFTTSEEKVPKVFNFKSDPKHVKALTTGKFDYVNLANNHILDFSISGLEETLQALDQEGISHVGAGRNEVEAKAPLVFQLGHITFGLVGMTDNEPGWKAGIKQPGIHYIEIGDIDAIAEEIENIKKRVDVLIASLHWGPNMRQRPTKTFRKFAHELVDSGVDVLHGHSAHIFQGVEYYKNSMILYDTGDLIDDYAVDPLLRNDCSFFFCIEFSKKGFEKLCLIPTRIDHFQVNKITGKEKEEIMTRMQKLSLELQTDLLIKEGYLEFQKKTFS